MDKLKCLLCLTIYENSPLDLADFFPFQHSWTISHFDSLSAALKFLLFFFFLSVGESK